MKFTSLVSIHTENMPFKFICFPCNGVHRLYQKIACKAYMHMFFKQWETVAVFCDVHHQTALEREISCSGTTRMIITNVLAPIVTLHSANAI